MRIGVMGAGSVGCYIGGRLAVGGAAVTLVGRAGLGETLAQHGLTVTDRTGTRHHLPLGPDLRFATEPAALSGCAVVLVTVKGPDTAAAGRAIAPHLGEAVVVSLQNGLDNAAILRAQLPGVVLAGMVPFNVLRLPEGRFHQGTAGPVVVEQTGREGPLLAALVAGGVPAVADGDMPSILWGKLMLNLNNALNALAGVPLREELSDRGYRRVLAAMMREGLAVGRATGRRARAVGTAPPWLAPWVLPLPSWLFSVVASSMVKIDPTARSSMWEDLQRGRRTEVDALNGAVVALGKEAGVPTPVNARVVAMVHAAEAAGAGSPGLGAASFAV